MSRRRWLAAAVIVVAAAGGCGADDADWERATCEPARPQPSGAHELAVGDRRALLHVPAAYDGSEAYPLVFSWHGYGSSADDHLVYADLRPQAEDGRFLVVVPQGEGDPTRFNLTAGIEGETDDVGFAAALIDHVAAEWCLDEARVYSTGVSNGAGMSALLACRMPDRIAAVGMVALVIHFDGCAGPPTPAMGMMGDEDLVVPIQGGEVNCCGGWPIAPAAESMQRWADAAGCEGRREKQVAVGVQRTTWHRCDGDAEVQYLELRQHGHTWPGGPDVSMLGPTSQAIDAAEVLWDFFRRFSLDEGS
ncbi:MAG TPA: PHB depolymerase family esterase [Acidimicrobiales bacterium]|nr:PHB depolymerase family esterase [Acidimicrobiales bacterium]